MKKQEKILRCLLVITAIFPIFYGICGMLSSQLIANISQALSGAQIQVTPEMSYLIKPLGAYIFMVGILCLYCAKQPKQNLACIVWIALLLLLRAGQRALLTPELFKLFQIPYWKNLGHSLYLALLAGSLLFFALRIRSKRKEGN